MATRRGLLHWMDNWVDLLLTTLAAAAIPLLIVETGDPDPGDASLVVGFSWVIWGAFTANLLLRLALSEDRIAAFRWLIPDAVLVVGQPLLSIGERKASPLLALVPLTAVGLRAVFKGRVLRRTGHQLRTHPLRVVGTVVPLTWVLSAALIFRHERDSGAIGSFGDGLWWSAVTLATVGYGDISPKTTVGRYIGVGTMVVGIGMFSVVTAQLAERLVAHRRAVGRTDVLETGHTLVLGWSPMVATILGELLLANRSRRDAAVVVMADQETEDMYAYLAAHVDGLDRTSTTVVCRTGRPSDPADLRRCHPERARSIVVVDADHDDAVVARTLLALLHLDAPPGDVPIVAEIDDRAIAASILHAMPGRVMVVDPVAFVARTAAQACLSAGVALTYEELLGVEGSELYVQAVEGSVGSTVADFARCLPDACLVGLQFASGKVDLAPPPGTVIAPGDQLVLLALDDAAVTVAPPGTWAAPGPVVPRGSDPLRPVRVLVLGWNELAPFALDELGDMVAPGSTVVVTVDPEVHSAGEGAVPTRAGNATVEVRRASGDAWAAALEAVAADGADHVMILCPHEGVDASEADTRALLTTLQVRRLLADRGHDPSVVTELRDQHDVALAPRATAGDFIVSEKLVSLLLAQLSEDRDLEAVFTDLLDPEGAELYCKPARWFGVTDPDGVTVPFGALVTAGIERGDWPIGVRRLDQAGDEAAAFGVRFNPGKDEPVRLRPDDQVIVVSDDAG